MRDIQAILKDIAEEEEQQESGNTGDGAWTAELLRQCKEAITALESTAAELRQENERLKGYFNKMEAVLNSDKYAHEKFDAVRKYINLSQIRINAALTESEGADVHEDAVVQSLIDGYDDLYDHDMHCGKD